MGDQKITKDPNSLVLTVYQRKRRDVSMAPDWSTDLPEELIISFAKRLTSLQDHIFFGAVCRSWRSAASEVKKKNPCTIASTLLTSQVPLLLLPLSYLQRRLPVVFVRDPVPRYVRQYPSYDNLTSQGLNEAVEFYSLKGKGNKISYKLNLAKILPNTAHTRMRMCFSSHGWLVIASHTKGCEWSLVHPFTHAKFDLPDVRSVPGTKGFKLRKFALSSSPSSTSDYTVMFHSCSLFGFCRPWRGESWKHIMVTGGGGSIMDLCFYEGQFYFVSIYSRVSVFDIDKQESRLVAPEFPKEQLLGPDVRIKEHYLVESAGVLLLVVLTTTAIMRRAQGLTFGCRVFEVPLTNSKSWSDSEVKSLGNRTIFLSQCSSSFSIEASDYSGLCKPNSICFMNNMLVSPRDCKLGKPQDIGVFNMGDGTISRDFNELFDYDEKKGSIYGFNPVCNFWMLWFVFPISRFK